MIGARESFKDETKAIPCIDRGRSSRCQSIYMVCIETKALRWFMLGCLALWRPHTLSMCLLHSIGTANGS